MLKEMLNLSLMLKIPLLQKFMKQILQLKTLMINQLNFKKVFRLISQSEKLIEPYGVDNSEISDIEILKKVLHGYHAAYFSCATLDISQKTMQH